jgi:hypothetical protein
VQGEGEWEMGGGRGIRTAGLSLRTSHCARVLGRLKPCAGFAGLPACGRCDERFASLALFAGLTRPAGAGGQGRPIERSSQC